MVCFWRLRSRPKQAAQQKRRNGLLRRFNRLGVGPGLLDRLMMRFGLQLSRALHQNANRLTDVPQPELQRDLLKHFALIGC